MNFFEWLVAKKAAPNYTARAGETIAGNLKRGGDGKFASAGSVTAKPTDKKPAPKAPAKPPVKPATKPTPKKLVPKKAKPKKTRAQYNAERAAKKKARLAAIAAAKKKKPGKVVAKPVKKPVIKKPVDPAKAAERQAAEQDRKKRRTDADARRATADQRRAVADQRRAARDAERAKPKEPKGGGGGGGGKDKPEKQLSPQDQRAKDLVTKLTAGDELDQAEQDELVRSGLARRDAKTGGLIVTAAGRSKLKEVSPLAVFKDATGRYRWILRSSTAFQDRDGEIVSTKALEQHVDRVEVDKNYGTLRFWHTPGLELGDCDFSMVYGRTLIESGTFRDERIGKRVAEKAADFEASLGFLHPPTEPVDGVYHTIRIFERSLVPKGKASNLFTGLAVIQEKNMATLAERVKAFFELAGDQEVAQAVLDQAALSEKAADTHGIVSKEATETLKADTAEMAAEDAAVETVEDEVVDDQVYVTDMTADELRMLVREVIAESMTTASAETTKAVSPVAQAVVAVGQKQQELDATYNGALKTVKDQLAALTAKLADLEGDTPHAVNERRASQQVATVTTNSVLKAAQPQNDPMSEFFTFAAKPNP
jgi:hypothetical protein